MNSFSPSVILQHIWSCAAEEVVLTVELRTVIHITSTEVPEFADSQGTLLTKCCSMQRAPCYVLVPMYFV